MANTVTYCRASTPVKNGTALVGVPGVGTGVYDSLTPMYGYSVHLKNSGVVYSDLDVAYSGRFNDPRYYSGDTPA